MAEPTKGRMIYAHPLVGMKVYVACCDIVRESDD